MLANPITNNSIRNSIKKDISLETAADILSTRSTFIISNLSLRKDVIESISLSILIILQ